MHSLSSQPAWLGLLTAIASPAATPADARTKSMGWRILPQLFLMVVVTSGIATGHAEPSAEQFDKMATAIEYGEIAPVPEEITRTLGELRNLLPGGDPARLVRYQRIHCRAAFSTKPRDGLDYAEQRIREAEARHDRLALGDLHYCLGSYQDALGNTQSAIKYVAIGLSHARAIGDRRLTADGLSLRGGVYSLIGEQALALRDLLETQAIYEDLKLGIRADNNLLAIATAYRRLGDIEKAKEYFAQGLAKAEARNDDASILATKMQLGFLREETGAIDLAQATYSEALALATALHDRDNAAAARYGLACTLNLQKKHVEALKLLHEIEPELVAFADSSNLGMLHLELGKAWAGLGEHAKALAEFDTAEPHMRENENLRYLILLYQERSRSHQALGDAKAALADLRSFVTTHDTLDRKTRSQQTDLLRYQFDTVRRDADMRRLAADNSLHKQEISSLQAIRQWQTAAIVMGALLILLVGYLGIRQVLRARHLQVMAMSDELTGIANRRRVMMFGKEAVKRAIDENRQLSVLTFDIDFFKRINDSCGHAGGDAVLVRVARATHAGLRQFDLLGRTGGEEFLVVLPRAPLDKAVQIAERLRAAVAALDVSDIAADLKVSISVGVAELTAGDADLAALTRRADDALYRAKANGRNRVESEN